MTKYKNPIDEAIGRTLNKPENEPLQGRIFDHLLPGGLMRGELPEPKKGQCCSVCDTFYFESENMIGNDGICKSCWQDLKELEDDCPDEDEEIEILAREEKKSKCF